MIELRTRKREMKGDRGNHHGKLGLREFRVRVDLPSPIEQIPLLIWRVITPIQGLPNPIIPIIPLISHIHSYPPYRSHLYSQSLFVVHNSTIITENKVKSHLSISACQDHELTLCAAYTKYSIHQVRYTPNTTYNQNGLCSLHCHDYELTPECHFGFRPASLQDRLPTAGSAWELKGKVTSSHSHGCELL